jgi:hypothetical protein
MLPSSSTISAGDFLFLLEFSLISLTSSFIIV